MGGSFYCSPTDGSSSQKATASSNISQRLVQELLSICDTTYLNPNDLLSKLNLSKEQAKQVLLKILQSNNLQTKRKALKTIGKLALKDQEIIDALLKILKGDKNLEIRSEAAKTLGALGIRNFPLLQGFSQDVLSKINSAHSSNRTSCYYLAFNSAVDLQQLGIDEAAYEIRTTAAENKNCSLPATSTPEKSKEEKYKFIRVRGKSDTSYSLDDLMRPRMIWPIPLKCRMAGVVCFAPKTKNEIQWIIIELARWQKKSEKDPRYFRYTVKDVSSSLLDDLQKAFRKKYLPNIFTVTAYLAVKEAMGDSYNYTGKIKIPDATHEFTLEELAGYVSLALHRLDNKDEMRSALLKEFIGLRKRKTFEVDAAIALSKTSSTYIAQTILEKWLEKNDLGIKLKAAKALVDSGMGLNDKLKKVLLQGLCAPPKYRKKAIQILSKWKYDDEIKQALIAAARSPYSGVQLEAIDVIKTLRINDAYTIKLLLDNLRSWDQNIRKQSVETIVALELLAHPDKLDADRKAVLQALLDANDPVIITAAQPVLFGYRIVQSRQLNHLAANDWYTRAKAIEMLGKLGIKDQKTEEALSRSLKDPHPAVRTMAGQALIAIHGYKPGSAEYNKLNSYKLNLMSTQKMEAAIIKARESFKIKSERYRLVRWLEEVKSNLEQITK